MIFWQWGKQVLNLGHVDSCYCKTCEKERDFYLSVIFSYVKLFWIPMFSWGAKYYYHCSICDTGIEVRREDYLMTEPIPPMYRWGWLIPVAGIAVFILYAWLGS